MKIELQGINKFGDERTRYTMILSPEGTIGCPMQVEYKNKPCNRPTKRKFQDNQVIVEVCGIHARALTAYGWTPIQS